MPLATQKPTAAAPECAPVGIGWRHPHYAALLEQQPDLDFIEVHSENFFAPGGAALAVLREGRERYPVSLHGVGLSLGSAAGLDPWHLDQLARLVKTIDPVRVSDHASFARSPGHHAADLLPVPMNRAALDVLCANVNQVQDRLQRTIAVENLSAYVPWREAEMDEPDFLNTLAQRTGCQLLVDVNNLYVNALNAQRRGQSLDPLGDCVRWLDAVEPRHVAELHLAGHVDCSNIVIDDHGSRVHEAVWLLHGHAVQRFGAVPTLIEWDTDLPAFQVLLDEAGRARNTASVHLTATARPADHPKNTQAGSALDVQQQALLQVLLARPGSADAESSEKRLAAWMDFSQPQSARGLAAYRANGHALAERALLSAYPVVAALIGADNFAQLARDLWHQHPPQRGDLAQWGGVLPVFLQRNTPLADVPYLSDVAQAEWALHTANGAADAVPDPASFARLAQEAPEGLALTLAPGTAVVCSAYPVASLISAHQHAVPRLDEAAERLRDGQGEHALVWRQGLRPRLQRIGPSASALVRALLAGADIPQALQAVDTVPHRAEGFDFSAWLHAAVADAVVVGVHSLPPQGQAQHPDQETVGP